MERIIQILKNFITKYFTIPHFLYILGGLIIFVGLILIVHYLYRSKTKKIKHMIESENDTAYLIVNLENRSLKLFSKVNLSQASNLTLETYLETFTIVNREQVVTWLEYQLSNDDIRTLELDEFSKKEKSYQHLVFVARKIDSIKKIIHIDCYTLNLNNKKIPCNPYVKQYYQLESIFYRLNKDSKVLISLISFFPTDTITDRTTYEIDPIIHYQVIELLTKLADNNHLITLLDNHNIVLTVINYDSEKDKFIERVDQEISKFYAVNDIEFQSFSIATLLTGGDNINLKYCVKRLNELVYSQIDHRNFSEHILHYSKEQIYDIKVQDSLKAELKTTIYNNEFTYEYRPIFSGKTCVVDSYNLKINTTNETFKDPDLFINTLYNSNLGDEFISLILENVNENFKDENVTIKRTSKKAAFYIHPFFIDSIISAQNVFDEHPDITYVIVMSDIEIKNYCDRLPNFIDKLRQMVRNNVLLRIKITVPEIMKPEFYYLASSFEFTDDLFNKFCNNPKDSLLIINLFAKITSSKKQLIACEISNWSTFETLICNKVLLFTGKIFEAENTINTSVSKRISAKVRSIYYKYY